MSKKRKMPLFVFFVQFVLGNWSQKTFVTCLVYGTFALLTIGFETHVSLAITIVYFRTILFHLQITMANVASKYASTNGFVVVKSSISSLVAIETILIEKTAPTILAMYGLV